MLFIHDIVIDTRKLSAYNWLKIGRRSHMIMVCPCWERIFNMPFIHCQNLDLNDLGGHCWSAAPGTLEVPPRSLMIQLQDSVLPHENDRVFLLPNNTEVLCYIVEKIMVYNWAVTLFLSLVRLTKQSSHRNMNVFMSRHVQPRQQGIHGNRQEN